jgi:uncharacterized protein
VAAPEAAVADEPTAVKLQPDRSEGVNIVTRIDGGAIWVGGVAHAHSILLPWTGDVQRWAPASFAQIGSADFDRVLPLQPELVIFGSGARLRFVTPALLRGLIERGTGVETMDTAAACRTYNVLAGEGRRVLAALLLEAAAP